MTAAPGRTTRARNRQIERSLQEEVAWQLTALGLLYIAIPNGLWIPTRTKEERELAKRIVHQMKATGMMTPNAPDFIVMHNGRGGCIELKRPESVDLLGQKISAGVQSKGQKAFQARAEAAGVPYSICSSWEDVRSCLLAWGLL